jgi:hypothetical protein
MALAPQATEVASIVLQDAHTSATRRILNSIPSQLGSEDDPFSFQLLLLSRPWMLNRCGWCLVNRFDESYGHQLFNCPQVSPDPDLTVYKLGNVSMRFASRGTPNLPRNNSICFWCFWPMHGHGPCKGRDACDPRHQLKQICWLIRFDEDIWTELKSYFSLSGPEAVGGHPYVSWLYQTTKTLTFKDQPATIINMHRVFLWYITIYKGVVF